MSNKLDRQEVEDLLNRMEGAPAWEIAEAIVDLCPSEKACIGDRKAERIGEKVGHLVQDVNGRVAAVTFLGRVTWLERNVMGPVEDKLHPSHHTRSSDASSYDVICTECGAHDIVGRGWGKLAEPCPVQDNNL
jgi:hypothetical protein